MSRRASLRAPLSLAAVAAVLLAPSPLSAQVDPNLERGFSPEKVYAFGEIDQVNLFNGNLMLGVPVGGGYAVGGALSYRLVLRYNSNVWDFQSACHNVDGQPVCYTAAHPNDDFNAGLGWKLSFGELHAPSGPGGNWRYVAEDGSEHVFYSTLHLGEPSTANVFYTRDGSYLRLKQVPNTSDLKYEVELPDGTIKHFLRLSTSGPFRLSEIRDRYGNDLDVSLGVNQWILTDGHRTHRIHFATRPNGTEVVSSVELAKFGGGTALYTFGYSDQDIDRSCLDDDPDSLGGTPPTVPVSFLTSVTLPDLSTYTFDTYNTTCFDGPTKIDNLPGTLAAMTLPTLGKLRWTYQTYGFPSRGPGGGGSGPGLSVTRVAGVKTKNVLDASGQCTVRDGVGCEWTYLPAGGSFGSPGPRTTTVTFPTGDKAVHHFDTSIQLDQVAGDGWQYGLPIHQTTTDGQGRFLSREIFDGLVKVRSTYLRYEHDALPSSTDPSLWYATNRRVASEKTVYHDDGNRFSEVTHSQFDGLGHYRRSVTSGNFDSGNARTAHTEFNPARGVYLNGGAAGSTHTPWPTSSPWVLGTFTETWQQEGGATAKQQYCFEAATGFLQRKRVLAGASPGPWDLLTVSTRDASGNVLREQSYGGDVQALGTGALCSLALPGDQFRVDHTYQAGSRATSRWFNLNGTPLPFYSLQLAIDTSTGLPTSAWDVSGLRTDFEYDAMGRLTWEKPEPGHGAWTQYTYFNATPTAEAAVRILRRDGSKSGALLARSRIHFDAMGRVAEERVFDSTGTWRGKRTTWNSMGWKHSVSEIGSGHATVFESYDPFGRPGTIVPPDGATHQVDLSYEGAREVRRVTRYNTANTLSTTTERYDRQGRLYQVVEPSGAGNGNVTTSYGYDVGGRLAAVFTTDGAAGTFQGRDFVYDHRGLLLRERHPEKGTSGNGWVRYLGYDALGNPGRKIDAVGASTATAGAEIDLTFTYDRASRLTHQYAKGVIFKTFEYGAANGAGDRRLGRLWKANRYNYVFLGPNPYTVRIEEVYTHGGPAGAVTARTTQAHLNGGAIEGFTQGWAYDQLGNVTTLTYPRCIAANCNGASTTSRTVGFAYTNGWLTSVPGYAHSISYHPNGMVHQVVHGDGTTYTQAADPSGMRRPASYTVANTATGTPMWQSGAYAYDGSGNVTAIGSATYTYDAVSRLVNGTVFTGPLASGSLLTQNATYDAYGNLTALASGPGTSPPVIQYLTNPSTNRLTAHPYDNSGAMTGWSGHVYDREDLGLIWKTTAAGQSYVHLYTADDERVWTFFEGQNRSRWTVRDLDGQVLREFANNVGVWTVQRDYVYRDGVPLAAALSTGHIHHLHPDHLGTPRLITRNVGSGPQQVAFHAYYPYGVEATQFNLDDERMKFTGHERDLGVSWSPADDLDYMHARWYNPQVGRFLSVDPIGGNTHLPQSWNRFTYGLNNPVRYIDPTGMLWTGFSAARMVQSIKFQDEITVIGSLGSASSGSGGDGPLDLDQAAFGNFLFGHHAGGAAFARRRTGPDTSLSLSERILSSLPEKPIHNIGTGLVGFGDTISFGLTDWLRGEDGIIDTTSTAYGAGRVAGVAYGVVATSAGGAVAAGAA
ncbi:MAG TPA: RHS repeat-associated core domain-containing protein, partial [Thermoanaerobaculia bacterium]|nr:RHS repeat-associated core domain-containing protein [Thermoanaerobaculia bacterium]